MALTVTKTANNWTDGGVRSGFTVSRYIVTATDSATYGYEDFFTALAAFRETGSTDADFTYTTPTPDNGDNNNPTRTFTIGRGAGLGTEEGAIIFIEFDLRHEFAETSRVVWGDNIWCGLMNTEPTAIDASGNNVDQVSITWPTGKSGSHTIDLGYVIWQWPGRLDMSSDGGSAGQARAVDLGSPQKTASATRIQSSLAWCGPAAGQRLTALDGRLYMTTNNNGNYRCDADFVGEGIIQVEGCQLADRNTAGSFFHNTNANPASSFNFRYTRSGSNGGGLLRNNPEIFSTFPELERHPYMSVSARTSPPFTALKTGNFNDADWSKYLPNFAGASRWNNTPVDNVVVNGVPGSGYADAAFVDASADWIQLDPSWVMDTDDGTPAVWSNNKPVEYVIARSNSVRNRNAAGVAKTTHAWTIGNQASAATRAFRRTATQSMLPTIRTTANGGTWSVREVNRTDGIGAHYLHDCTRHGSTLGSSSADWTRLDNADNESWILHRGGLHRYSQNVPLRTTAWDPNSLGSTANVTNNDVDDLDCFNDNLLLLWGTNHTGDYGMPFLANGAITTTDTTFNIDGLAGLDASLVTNMIGANVQTANAANIVGTITAAELQTNGSVNITIAAAASVAVADNAQLYVIQANYSWSIDSDDGQFHFTSANTKTLTYGGFASMVQAKLERIAATKLSTLGSETQTYAAAQDAFWDTTANSGSTLINELLAAWTSVTGTDASYVKAGSFTGSIDMTRFASVAATGSHTVTLSPDLLCTHINFGSGFTVPLSLVMNGSYTDSTGTPSFIDVVLPSGVDTDDIAISVVYRDSDSEYYVGSNPTLQIEGSRRFFRVESQFAYPSNSLGWSIGITGPKTNDSYTAFAAMEQTATITLVQNVNRPTTASASTGSLKFEGWFIDSESAKSATDTELVPEASYPKNYIQRVNRLMLDFGTLSPNTGYSNATSGNAGIRNDVLNAKSSVAYADYIARYGADPGGAIVGTGAVDLDTDNYRIFITFPSTANFLFMEGVIPNNSAYYVYQGTTQVDPTGNFGAPEYDASLVGIEVENVLNPFEARLDGDLDRLAANQVRLSRGIPPKSTVSS